MLVFKVNCMCPKTDVILIKISANIVPYTLKDFFCQLL